MIDSDESERMQRRVHRQDEAGAGDNRVVELGPPHLVASPMEMPSPAHNLRASIAWGISGFVIGAAFWHLVGFWGFIEKIVYTGRADEPSHYVEQTGPECAAVVLDRDARSVVVTTCPTDTPLLNESAHSIRGDFSGPASEGKPAARSARNLRYSFGDR